MILKYLKFGLHLNYLLYLKILKTLNYHLNPKYDLIHLFLLNL
jgi:hypothetical protein